MMKKMTAVILSLALLCTAFGAFAEAAPAVPAQPENAPLFDTVGQARENSEPTGQIAWENGLYVMITIAGDRALRVVAALDEDTCQQLYDLAFSDADFETREAKELELTAPLPVLYTEDFTDTAKTPAELDALTGKTLQELADEGYVIEAYSSDGEDTVIFDLSCGLFVYECLISESEEVFEQLVDTGDFGALTVKSARLLSVSDNATDLTWNADGTRAPEPEDSDSFSSLLGELASLFGEAGENGEATLDQLFQGLADAFGEAGESAEENLDELLQGLDGAMTEAGDAGEEKLGEIRQALSALWAEAEENGSAALEEGQAQLSDLLQRLETALKETGETREAELNEILEALREALKTAGRKTGEAVDQAQESLEEAAPEIQDGLSELVNLFTGWFQED